MGMTPNRGPLPSNECDAQCAPLIFCPDHWHAVSSATKKKISPFHPHLTRMSLTQVYSLSPRPLAHRNSEKREKKTVKLNHERRSRNDILIIFSTAIAFESALTRVDDPPPGAPELREERKKTVELNYERRSRNDILIIFSTTIAFESALTRVDEPPPRAPELREERD